MNETEHMVCEGAPPTGTHRSSAKLRRRAHLAAGISHSRLPLRLNQRVTLEQPVTYLLFHTTPACAKMGWEAVKGDGRGVTLKVECVTTTTTNTTNAPPFDGWKNCTRVENEKAEKVQSYSPRLEPIVVDDDAKILIEVIRNVNARAANNLAH